MDEPELQLLRTFRAEDATVPDDLGTRIEGDLWQAIRREEHATRRARRRLAARGPRSTGRSLLRPALTLGVAASLLVLAANVGGLRLPDDVTSRDDNVPAGVEAMSIPATATRLFGTATASATTVSTSSASTGPAPAPAAHHEQLLAGPGHDPSTGALDVPSQQLVAAAPRDAEALWSSIQASLAYRGTSDPSHRHAFLAAMRWVVAPDVPPDLRAAMFRTLGAVRGLETATVGVDMLGRTGILIGHLDPTTGIREQFLLDARTAQLFEHRTYTTAEIDPACPPSTLVAHDLYSIDGHRIAQADAAWIVWPGVRPECMLGT